MRARRPRWPLYVAEYSARARFVEWAIECAARMEMSEGNARLREVAGIPGHLCCVCMCVLVRQVKLDAVTSAEDTDWVAARYEIYKHVKVPLFSFER